MKCPACNTIDLVAAKRQGFHMEYCPDCRGIWFERIEIDRILHALNNVDHSSEINDVKVVEQKVQLPVNAQKNSPILDSMYARKELHNLHNLKGKHPHWIHRLFD